MLRRQAGSAPLTFNVRWSEVIPHAISRSVVMITARNVWLWALLVVAATLSTACFHKPFQPAPYEEETWDLNQHSQHQINVALLECGYEFHNLRQSAPQALVERCMEANGFKKATWNGRRMETVCQKTPQHELCLLTPKQVPVRSRSTRLVSATCEQYPFADMCLVDETDLQAEHQYSMLERSKAWLECGAPDPFRLRYYRWNSFKDPVTGKVESQEERISEHDLALAGLCMRKSGMGLRYGNLCKLHPEYPTCASRQTVPVRDPDRRLNSLLCKKEPYRPDCRR